MTVPAAARTPEGGYIGAPIPRREDARLLTGRGTFVDDLEMPGVAHAAMVRSPHAHARVRRIDTTAARALPGVLAVVTAADIEDIQKPWPARMPSPVPGTGLGMRAGHGFWMSSMSAAVTTASTPGSARAAVVSIRRTRAWACGLRTIAAWATPGISRSS